MSTIMRLIMVEDENANELNQFLSFIEGSFQQLTVSPGDANTVLGSLTDLRALFTPVVQKKVFQTLLPWFRNFSPILREMLQVPMFTIDVLKVWRELTINKSQRWNLETGSNLGVLICRDIGDVVCGYATKQLGSATTGSPVSPLLSSERRWEELKGTYLCMYISSFSSHP